MRMTQREYLDWWNNNKIGDFATIEQVTPCDCGFPNCKGWYIAKKEKNHIRNVYQKTTNNK
jgi:hypothetical protein